MKFKLFCVVFAAMFLLAACGNGNNGANDNNGNNADDNGVEHTRYNNDANDENGGQTLRNAQNGDRDRGNLNNNNNNNNNDRYDISKEAADKITDKVAGIDHAYVLTTKNNAYVAAALDENNNNNNGNMNNRNNDNNGVNNDNNGVTNNRADNGHELTEDKKHEIRDIVKSVDNDIDHVYVSTNPDFMNLANNYADDVNNGKPVRGMFDQIGNMIERVFPQNNNR
ncbi:YhcN/YlaJ family sporulation lipoprotein [Lentibacillus sp. N15]|uniref:YhcN/YlaJ family sporulation lipoprotein n=1 Tax=Lentibacillus songyuanensis TaxID=3136161 RepID=UPI0031BA5282